jgi:hypothetical protein
MLTETEFIEKMIEMKRIAIQKPNEAAQNYFLMANGFYNITYFGNSGDYLSGSIYGSFYNCTAPVDSPVYTEDMALKYYLLAREKSSDPEFKAKCTFMAAKCEQNHFFAARPENYAGDFRAGDYFAELKKNYSKTKYYSEVIRECGYFRTYLSKQD